MKHLLSTNLWYIPELSALYKEEKKKIRRNNIRTDIPPKLFRNGMESDCHFLSLIDSRLHVFKGGKWYITWLGKNNWALLVYFTFFQWLISKLAPRLSVSHYQSLPILVSLTYLVDYWKDLRWLSKSFIGSERESVL